MISDELNKAIDQIKDQGKIRFLEAATEEQIARFEKDNNIQIPARYKEWLQYSDGGELYLPARCSAIRCGTQAIDQHKR